MPIDKTFERALLALDRTYLGNYSTSPETIRAFAKDIGLRLHSLQLPFKLSSIFLEFSFL